MAARLLQQPAFLMPITTSVGDCNNAALGRVAKSESERGRDIACIHKDYFAVSPLQMEYGNADLPKARIDLAILDPIDIPRIADAESFQDAEGNYLSPLIGAEFFTEKSGGTEEAIQRHLGNDANKANKCKHGYVINVFRNHRMTKRGMPRSDATDEKLDRFRRLLSIHKAKHPSLVWIGMIVHLSFADVEFFTADAEWKKIDLTEGRQQVGASIASLMPTHQGNHQIKDMNDLVADFGPSTPPSA